MSTSLRTSPHPGSRPPLICDGDGCDFTTYDSAAWDRHQMNTGHRLYEPDVLSDTIEVCVHCGETRERVLFYGASCTPDDQYDGLLPGPPGEHEWGVLTRDEQNAGGGFATAAHMVLGHRTEIR